MLEQPTIRRQSDEVEALATMDRVLNKEHCHRCGGLMIHDHCLDMKSDSGEVEVKVLRCCTCGELIDPIILRNRLRDEEGGKACGATSEHLRRFSDAVLSR
ncbi:MAG: hypothetical protein NPIRA02_39550 [Nitrospirales bacterium]|nr:MAG: hypothetical protein NPIRA02_39550 [Nitrospirales bacterium]